MHGQLIQHELPADFAKHPNTPWDALKAIDAGPYVVTIDSFSAASNVWSPDADGLKLVTSLQPPLPGDILARRAKGLFSREHSLLIIAFDAPAKHSAGVICAYTIPSGTLVQELELPSLALDQVFTASPSSTHIAAALASPPQIALYQIHAHGLTELRRITPALESFKFFPVHVTDDGAVLAASTSVPSPVLPLTLHLPTPAAASPSATLTLTLPHDPALDWLVPSRAVLIPSSSSSSHPTLILAVSGTSSASDHRYTKTTIFALALEGPSSLSTIWSLNLHYAIAQLTYHPALSALAVLQADSRSAGLTLINPHTSKDLRTVSLPPFPDAPHVPPRVQCTTNDELVVVLPSGKLFVEPLGQILQHGLSDDKRERQKVQKREGDGEEEEEVLKMQAAPVRPEPHNAKAKKAGERWSWVDSAVIVPGGVVLLPVRGPQVFYVRW